MPDPQHSCCRPHRRSGVRSAPLLPLLFVFLAVFLPSLRAQPFVAGQTYYGQNNYIEYRAGDLPIILTAPHGGSLTPSKIPDRTYGTTVTDTNTRELAIACYDEIVSRTGKRPHLVICHLNRIKLDPNRDIVEGAQGNSFAEQAWTEFHGYIAAARAAARESFGFGFLVDLHGHGHSIHRLELGYALGGTQLNVSDAALSRPGYAWMSTLRTLALARPGLPFPTLLRGHRSLGDLFNRRSVPAWPAPDFPSPGDALFFDGGHIVRTHSCILDNDTINGVQIETHYSGIRDTASSRATFATRFAQVLQPYLWDNYGYDLGTLSLSRIQPPASSVLTRGGPPLTLTIRRTGHLGLSTTLPVTLGGTAVRGTSGDYTSTLNSTVYFAAGATTATFTITPNAATSSAGDKTIVVTLDPTATQTADTTPLVLTLGDGSSQVVRVEALTPSLSESAGPARFRLTRTKTSSALTVPLLWSGTALPGADYLVAPGSATFADGVATTEIAVPLIDDGRPAPDRTLTLGLGAGAGFSAGYPSSATARILDDDRPAGLAVWLRGDLEGNVALDSSGLDRHATTLPADDPANAVAGPAQTFDASANNAPAIVFDGVDDTLALPKFTLDPDGSFTLAFFFRLEAGGTIANQNIATYGTRNAAGSLHLYLATTNATNGTVSLRTNLPGLATNALDVPRTSPLSWQDGAWRHYALSVATDGTARVYIDGVLRKTASGRTGTLAPDELLWFGWRPASAGAAGFMSGAFRDIRVYQRALPETEIAALASGRANFAAWLGAHGLSPALDATDDPDGDALSCFLEYGLSASPRVAAPAPAYTTGLDAGRLTLSFLRNTSASDLVWTVEATDDLGSTWQAVATRSASDTRWTILLGGASVTETNGHVRVTDAAPLALHPRRFVRLRVTAL